MSKEMKISREKKKEEAIARLEMLGVKGFDIKIFKKGDRPLFCFPIGFGCLADDDDMTIVESFEREHNALVYALICDGSPVYCLLFVSDNGDEWEEIDRKDLRNNMAIAYVYNKEAPDRSEMGSVGLELNDSGNLYRAW